MSASVDRHLPPISSAGPLARLGDSSTLVSLYIILMLGLPARLVVPGLGAAGRPAVLLGVGMLVVWLLRRAAPGLTRPGGDPVRVSLVLLLTTTLIAYALGQERGLLPLEVRSADRYLIVFASWLGVALLSAEVLQSRVALRRAVACLVAMTSFSAVLGALQFYGLDLAPYVRLPGLVYNGDLVGLRARGGPAFNRVYGTSQHYIEFGVVLAMVLPLAIHQARTEVRERRTLRWVQVVLLAAAIPFSVSRAGFLGLVIGGLVLGSTWPLRAKIRAGAVTLFGILVYQVLNPGLLGTIRSLFTNLDNDPSIEGRRVDYAAVGQYVQDRPYFGRGPGTFVPEIYRVLDNQFLGSVLEVGYIGTACLLAVYAGAFFQARAVRKRASRQEDAHLAAALSASVAVALVTSFTFDSLFFPTFAGTFFLTVGLVGASWRVHSLPPAEPEEEAPLVGRPFIASTSGSTSTPTASSTGP